MRHSAVAGLIENRLIFVWKLRTSCTVRLQGRPSWPSARSTDRISAFHIMRTATIYLPVVLGHQPPNIMCKPLILRLLQNSATVGVRFIPILPAAGEFTVILVRSCEGWDKPSPFYVANQTIDFYLFFFNSDYQHFSICCTFV